MGVSGASLTTGKAAKLCSVQPDTVLKWIKKGRLPAVRTAGGHFRIAERDLTAFLGRNGAAESDRPGPGPLCSRPMRCWEYMNHGPGDECAECAVHRVHAAYCYRMVNLVKGAGHARRFCAGLCQECPYYRRIHGLPTNVLVITTDEGLIQQLGKRQNEAIAFRFARRGYDASAIITVFRPAFVVLDQAIVETLGVALLEALAADPRARGARIVLAIRKGNMSRRLHSDAIFATVEEPFNADEIVAMVDHIPVETVPEDDEGLKTRAS